MSWKEYKKELLANPEFAGEYQGLAAEHELARSAIALRLKRKLTQQQLADRLGTKQSGIARLESARSKPSIRFLERLAEALDATLVVKLEPNKPRDRRRRRD